MSIRPAVAGRGAGVRRARGGGGARRDRGARGSSSSEDAAIAAICSS